MYLSDPGALLEGMRIVQAFTVITAVAVSVLIAPWVVLAGAGVATLTIAATWRALA